MFLLNFWLIITAGHVFIDGYKFEFTNWFFISNICKGVIVRIATILSMHTIVYFVTVLTLLAPVNARADFFKYKDNSGALIITNRFEDVPKQYQNRVKVIWDKDLEAKDPLARRQAAAREQYEQRERQEAGSRAKQEAKEMKKAKKGQTLVVEMDEVTGEIKRRFE